MGGMVTLMWGAQRSVGCARVAAPYQRQKVRPAFWSTRHCVSSVLRSKGRRVQRLEGIWGQRGGELHKPVHVPHTSYRRLGQPGGCLSARPALTPPLGVGYGAVQYVTVYLAVVPPITAPFNALHQ